MNSKENRIVASSTFFDLQEERICCHPTTLRQISCEYQPQISVELLDKLSGGVSPRFQPWFGSLTKLRSSTEGSQSIVIFSSAESSTSSEFCNSERGVKSLQVQMSIKQAKLKICNCSKSRCLKKHCQCFKAGQVCSKDTCECTNCQNWAKSDIHLLNQKQAEEKKNTISCNCKQAQCQSGYCECYRSNKGCKEKCQCVGCQNKYGKHVPSGSGMNLRKKNV